MKRLVMGAIGLGLAGFLVSGCGALTGGGCKGTPTAVAICYEGKRVDFSSAKLMPHIHEGNLYVPVESLATALRVPVQVDATQGQVTVNGKEFVVRASANRKGIHIHEGVVFVPVKEFVEAVGLHVDAKLDEGTVTIAK